MTFQLFCLKISVTYSSGLWWKVYRRPNKLWHCRWRDKVIHKGERHYV